MVHIKERIGDYKICMDQGFLHSGDATGILVGLIPERSAWQLHSTVRDNLIRLSNAYMSLCQASEWGMRGLQGTFPRCKNTRLPSDKDKCRCILECIFWCIIFKQSLSGIFMLISGQVAPNYVYNCGKKINLS